MYLLGGERKEGAFYLGRHLARDGSLGAEVYLDGSRPHAILICGKRGYGKSYSLGVLAEGLCDVPGVASLLVDTMGVFWTMRHGNTRESDALLRWNLEPGGMEVKTHMPALSIGSLSQLDWSRLLGLGDTGGPSTLLARALDDMDGDFDLPALCEKIREYGLGMPDADVLLQRLRSMDRWGVFARRGLPTDYEGVNVLDLSVLGHQSWLSSLVVGRLAGSIYDRRHELRREYEESMLRGEPRGMSMLWMLIDEAHVFLPRDRETPASRVLMDGWLRQGRQLGLSLVLATQRPSALDPDVLSQADLIICHRLTAQEDIEALSRVRPTYMQSDLGDAIQRMGTERGRALIIDDCSESVYVVRMRPRQSWHGGDEPNALG